MVKYLYRTSRARCTCSPHITQVLGQRWRSEDCVYWTKWELSVKTTRIKSHFLVTNSPISVGHTILVWIADRGWSRTFSSHCQFSNLPISISGFNHWGAVNQSRESFRTPSPPKKKKEKKKRKNVSHTVKKFKWKCIVTLYILCPWTQNALEIVCPTSLSPQTVSPSFVFTPDGSCVPLRLSLWSPLHVLDLAISI